MIFYVSIRITKNIYIYMPDMCFICRYRPKNDLNVAYKMLRELFFICEVRFSHSHQGANNSEVRDVIRHESFFYCRGQSVGKPWTICGQTADNLWANRG